MDKRDLAGSAIWVILSITAFAASLRLGVGALRSPGPGFIPFLASIGLAFFACLLLAFNLTAKKQAGRRENGMKDTAWGNPLIVIVALAIYGLALGKLGYLLTTFGLMMVLFSRGEMKARMVILGSLIASLASYGLFAFVLGTPLPRGILGF
jgi:hypothetical protein